MGEQIKFAARFRHPDNSKNAHENDYMLFKLQKTIRSTIIVLSLVETHFFMDGVPGSAYGWDWSHSDAIPVMLNTKMQSAATQ